MISKIKGYIVSNFYHLKHQYFLKNSKKIIIGSCYTSQKGWFPSDFPEIDITSIVQCAKYWKKNSKLAFVAEHVWEHLEPAQALAGAECCFYFLKKGGRLRIAVPDGYHPNPEYIEYVKPNGFGLGSSDHKVLYNIDSLTEVFKKAKFTVIPLEYWDSQSNFKSTDWDSKWGEISRSAKNDRRNTTQNPLAYTSIIIDCLKDSFA